MARRSRDRDTRGGGGRASRSRKGRVVSVDFKGVDLEGGAVRIKEDDYPFVVAKATQEVADSSGDEMIVVVAEGTDGAARDKKFRLYFSLNESALWKLGGFLKVIGMDVPDEALDIDLDELEGAEFMGVVQDDTYERNGQDRTVSKIMDFFSIEEGGSAEPRGRNRDKGGGRERGGRERGGREARSERGGGRDRDRGGGRRSARDERGGRNARDNGKGGDEIPADDVKAMDEDELADLIKELRLKDVDLDEFNSLRRKQSAVIAALEAEGLLAQ